MKWLLAIIEWIEYIATGDKGTYNRPVETPPEILMEPVAEEPAPPVDQTVRRMELYNLAKSCLGRDIAKTQNELGCAEAISFLFVRLEVAGFAKPVLSTNQLYHFLLTSLAFVEVEYGLPGDIVISPSGYSTKGYAHGHVGICGFHGIMSNNSMTGLWDQYYTDISWHQYYHDKLGFPIAYFRRL